MVPFISTADLSALLGEDVTADPLAIIALDSACEIIRSYVGQRLNFDALDVVSLHGNGRGALILPEIPVVDIASVVEDDEVLDPEDYFAISSGLLYKATLYDTWSPGIRNVVVTYSHGYAVLELDVEDDPDDTTPKPNRMPADIRRVALALSRRVFVASGSVSETGTKASESITPSSYAYTNAVTSGSASTVVTTSTATELSPDEEAILDRHRIASLA